MMTLPKTSSAPTPDESGSPAPSTTGSALPAVPRASFDWARSRDIVLTIIGGAVLLYLLGMVLASVLKIILIFVLSAVVAFMLEPLVGRLERRGIARGWATAACYSAFILALGGALFWIGGALALQFGQLNAQVPAYTEALQAHWLPMLQEWLLQHGVPADLSHLQQDAGPVLQATGADLVGHSLGIVTGVGSTLLDFILVVVVSIYLVLDGRRIRDLLAGLVPPQRQRLFAFLETSLVRVLGGYIRGQLLMAAIIGLSTGIGCWVLGVQYPLVLGVLAFFCEMIPMIGPVLAAIPGIGVSLLQPFPLVLFVMGFFVVMQLVESHVLGPRIAGHAVGLHPIASILALIGGAEVAGFWGALFAVPVVGLAAVFGMAAYNELKGKPPEEVIRPRKAWGLSVRGRAH